MLYKHDYEEAISEDISKIIVLEFCLISHSRFITVLFIRWTIKLVSAIVDSKHISYGSHC